jgi:uncharacterized protein (TIGR00251 family)
MNVEVHVITRAKKREIRAEGTGLKVKLTSLPVEGKANEELVEYLAKVLSVKRSDVRIVRGEKQKKKLVSIPIDGETLALLLKEKARVTNS